MEHLLIYRDANAIIAFSSVTYVDSMVYTPFRSAQGHSPPDCVRPVAVLEGNRKGPDHRIISYNQSLRQSSLAQLSSFHFGRR